MADNGITDRVDGKIAAMSFLLLRHLDSTTTREEIESLQAFLEKDISDLSKIDLMPGFSSEKRDGMLDVLALFHQHFGSAREAASTNQTTQTESPKSWPQRLRDMASAGLVIDKVRSFVTEWMAGS